MIKKKLQEIIEGLESKTNEAHSALNQGLTIAIETPPGIELKPIGCDSPDLGLNKYEAIGLKIEGWIRNALATTYFLPVLRQYLELGERDRINSFDDAQTVQPESKHLQKLFRGYSLKYQAGIHSCLCAIELVADGVSNEQNANYEQIIAMIDSEKVKHETIGISVGDLVLNGKISDALKVMEYINNKYQKPTAAEIEEVAKQHQLLLDKK